MDELHRLESMTSFHTTAVKGSPKNRDLLQDLCKFDLQVDCNNPEEPCLGIAIVLVNQELFASRFNLFHGFYRQAFFSLRSVVELILAGVSLEVFKSLDDKDLVTSKLNPAEIKKWGEQWVKSEKNVKFPMACKILKLHPVAVGLEKYLDVISESFFLQEQSNNPGGWIWRFYSELSNYAHSKPGYTNTNIWSGPLPFYNSEIFDKFSEYYYKTIMACLIFVKIINDKFILTPPLDQLINKNIIKNDLALNSSNAYLFK